MCFFEYRNVAITQDQASDFIVSINITKELLVSRLLRLFEERRNEINFGGPYRTKLTSRGRKPQLESIDLLGLPEDCSSEQSK